MDSRNQGCVPGPFRDTTVDERAVWGECPVCKAQHGEACNADVGLQLGMRSDGRRMQDGDGAHLPRFMRAPLRVREVPA